MQLITVGTVAFGTVSNPVRRGRKDRWGCGYFYISLAASVFLEKMGLASVVGDDFGSLSCNSSATAV